SDPCPGALGESGRNDRPAVAVRRVADDAGSPWRGSPDHARSLMVAADALPARSTPPRRPDLSPHGPAGLRTGPAALAAGRFPPARSAFPPPGRTRHHRPAGLLQPGHRRRRPRDRHVLLRRLDMIAAVIIQHSIPIQKDRPRTASHQSVRITPAGRWPDGPAATWSAGRPASRARRPA